MEMVGMNALVGVVRRDFDENSDGKDSIIGTEECWFVWYQQT